MPFGNFFRKLFKVKASEDSIDRQDTTRSYTISIKILDDSNIAIDDFVHVPEERYIYLGGGLASHVDVLVGHQFPGKLLRLGYQAASPSEPVYVQLDLSDNVARAIELIRAVR